MQHAESIPASFPWRTATLVVGVIATLELFVLIGIGAVHLAPKKHAPSSATASAAAAPRPAHIAHKHKAPRVPTHPLRARSGVNVLVLNGNGVQGAASSEASRLRIAGYRVGGARNAARRNYGRSLVLYVPGWVKEARRLARDTGLRIVAPVDGLRPSMLKGSKLVVILGNA
ncbi:MAG TPA: LytR C-terminal domain-containing protein [Gaiellaceae bacterium]